MLGLTAIAMKIVLNNGKDLQRELIGTKINRQMGWTHTDLDQISNIYSIATAAAAVHGQCRPVHKGGGGSRGCGKTQDETAKDTRL